MNGQELLQKLLVSYESSFNISRPYSISSHEYDAYAKFNVTSAKYVLVKRAELWRANCFEHTMFMQMDQIGAEQITWFHEDITSYIEPQLVRHGENCTEENHMYTYMTGIFISERGLSKETQETIRKFRYLKNYRMGFRGYSEARVLVFDMENKSIAGNRAAKDLIKGYEKVF